LPKEKYTDAGPKTDLGYICPCGRQTLGFMRDASQTTTRSVLSAVPAHVRTLSSHRQPQSLTHALVLAASLLVWRTLSVQRTPTTRAHARLRTEGFTSLRTTRPLITTRAPQRTWPPPSGTRLT